MGLRSVPHPAASTAIVIRTSAAANRRVRVLRSAWRFIGGPFRRLGLGARGEVTRQGDGRRRVFFATARAVGARARVVAAVDDQEAAAERDDGRARSRQRPRNSGAAPVKAAGGGDPDDLYGRLRGRAGGPSRAVELEACGGGGWRNGGECQREPECALDCVVV